MKIAQSWYKILESEFEKPYYKNLQSFLNQEYQTRKIYPPADSVFNALNYVPYEKIKVVILGQDPYHQPNQAEGLSFSVAEGVALPPSLKNIFKELESDLGIKKGENGSLKNWARQGVLLLNTTLTVREGQPNSHKGQGWETLTTEIIKIINNREKPVIFVLWGNNAKSVECYINKQKHHIIASPHPSPFSAYSGFFGSKPFSKINKILKESGESEIEW